MDKVFKNLTVRDIGTALLDLAMPRLCVVCRRPLLLRERFICTRCLADLPLTHFWSLSHNPMADRFNARIQDSLSSGAAVIGSQSAVVSASACTDTSSSPSLASATEPYAYAAALFFYNSESDYKRIPQHLKYQGGLASGRFFAAMLGRALAAEPLYADVDVLVPVPLHWARQWRRGYNQAEVIARELASALGAECRADWLCRVRRTATQTRVSVAAKSANVSGAFRPSASLLRFAAAARIRTVSARPQSASLRFRLEAGPVALPRHVLLVDDTFTTGATLNACRAALRTALPSSVRISAATLAFVSV